MQVTKFYCDVCENEIPEERINNIKIVFESDEDPKHNFSFFQLCPRCAQQLTVKQISDKIEQRKLFDINIFNFAKDLILKKEKSWRNRNELQSRR